MVQGQKLTISGSQTEQERFEIMKLVGNVRD